MASELRVDKIIPSSGTSIGIGTTSGTINFLGTSQINTTGVVTASSFSGSGASLTNIPAGNLTGTIADARISTLTASKLSGALPAISAANLTSIPAANLTGTLPTISGANLTNLPAGNLTGIVTAARLGGGSASSSTFLRGDGTFAEAGGGTIGAYVTDSTTTSYTITSSNTFQNGVHSVTITPTKAGSKMLILIGSHGKTSANPNNGCYFITRINRNVAGGGSTNIHNCLDSRLTYTNGYSGNRIEAYGPLHPAHHVDTPSYTLGQSIVYTFDIGASMNVGSSTRIIWNDSYYNQSHFTVMELTT